ncbi:MAG: cation-transporting P-type ATPase [Candidatus Omnitrophica bacterium]|nr:cation-transporting P-type ATPase [Candidatus Omnitrophota bacterium]
MRYEKLQNPGFNFDYIRVTTEELLGGLKTSREGLTDEEASKRLEEYGHNEPARKKKRTILLQLFSKFLNPLVIVLLIIAAFSFFFNLYRYNRFNFTLYAAWKTLRFHPAASCLFSGAFHNSSRLPIYRTLCQNLVYKEIWV